MVPTALLTPILSLLEGPVFSIIDKLIPDPTLKAKLKAEITTKVISHKDQIIDAQRRVVLQELAVDSVLTRSWRPILMFLIMVLLLVYGLVLPFADLFADSPIAFKPRWQDIPDGLWNLLSLGLGGYIGGRSLEKIVNTLKRPSSGPPSIKKFRRKFNFNNGKDTK